MSYSKQDLSDYRRERAKEAIVEAKLLASSRHWNSVANRLYYACFYITTAYLILDEITASTHTGIKTSFNKELVNKGLVTKEEGQLYNKLFSLRQDADYRDFKDVSEAQIAPLIERVEKLVIKIDGLIRQR